MFIFLNHLFELKTFLNEIVKWHLLKITPAEKVLVISLTGRRIKQIRLQIVQMCVFPVEIVKSWLNLRRSAREFYVNRFYFDTCFYL